MSGAFFNEKKIVKAGNVEIGGGKLSIQTMLKNSINNIALSIDKIHKLKLAGCDIIRAALPDEDSAVSLKEVLKEAEMPVVADIHFDHKLAIKAIEAGVQKLRINPGNIGDENKVKEVISCLKEYNIPVRIGINCGSLPKHLLNKYDNNVQIMIEAAKEEISYFEKNNYTNIVLSFKSSNVIETINVNRLAFKYFNYPLHIGVTEAGDYIDGAIKNSAGLSVLLLEGIGDTVRVSLTADEFKEVEVAKKILESIGKKEADMEIISCPTCGRTEVNIEEIVRKIKEALSGRVYNKKLKIAVMGCIVNGPGAAKGADFGIACGKGKSILFKDGKELKVIKNNQILDELLLIVKKFYEK